MMQRRWRQRGSVLLLAVGLLSILAMLGATLLLSSYLDARQSRALAAKAQADPVATGILAQVKAALQADLYLGADGPYEGLSADANGWRQFIDHPSEDVDPHLASPWTPQIRAGTAPWPHVSNLFNDTTNITDVAFDDDALTDTDGDIDGVLGDPLKDARWYDTGVTNALGQRYYAAVRVTDMSGKICLNTAGTSNALTTPTSPVNVDLESFLLAFPGTSYTDLHDDRCGGLQSNQSFWDDSASRLFAPDPGYRPFAIGEEMYFRWLGAGQLTQAGRLRNHVPTTPDDFRHLTTFNCSRTLVRNPAAPLTEQIIIDPTLLSHPDPNPDPNDLFSPNGRNDVYQKVEAMLEALSIGSKDERPEMAAHFVANMWAYMDTDANMNATDHWRFDPPGTNFRVFGLRQDLVITEAYARHIPDTGDQAAPNDDWVYGCAIELMNPTNQAIDLNQYKLIVMKPGTITLPSDLAPGAPAVAGNGGKIVIHNFQEGSNNQVARGQFFNTPTATWVYNTDLDFTGSDYTRIKIVRQVGSYLVPIDEVWAPGNLDYTALNPKFELSDAAEDIRRDDDLDRARYNVGAYEANTDTPPTHTLGNANDLLDSDLATEAVFSVPIIRSGQQIVDLGELGLIYLTGPVDDEPDTGQYRALVSFPMRLVQLSSTLTDGPARGRFDFHPDDIGYLGYNSGTHPDVPAAAMLGEFFTVLPPDYTRTDEPTRIYGRVNINTATREVLIQLPWPGFLGEGLPGQGDAVITNDIVDYILAYRDQADPPGVPDYTDRENSAGAGIQNLRATTDSDIDGFLTPGEIAIPLADYANWRMGWSNYTDTPQNSSTIRDIVQDQYYIRNRDSLYRAISNLITVNSDVYAVNIRVDLYDINEAPDNDPPNEPLQSWYYVSVIDRSNCSDVGDTPAVLLFSEVK